ncbi:MAG TPA: hypothetical protein VF297_05275 [Pyrinomonadaceae bacterium]
MLPYFFTVLLAFVAVQTESPKHTRLLVEDRLDEELEPTPDRPCFILVNDAGEVYDTCP